MLALSRAVCTHGRNQTKQTEILFGRVRTMASTESADAFKPDPLVMYIFVRTDLDWPQGAVAAQACHGMVFAPPVYSSRSHTFACSCNGCTS